MVLAAEFPHAPDSIFARTRSTFIVRTRFD
jgi:hypothetical protein